MKKIVVSLSVLMATALLNSQTTPTHTSAPFTATIKYHFPNEPPMIRQVAIRGDGVLYETSQKTASDPFPVVPAIYDLNNDTIAMFDPLSGAVFKAPLRPGIKAYITRNYLSPTCEAAYGGDLPGSNVVCTPEGELLGYEVHLAQVYIGSGTTPRFGIHRRPRAWMVLAQEVQLRGWRASPATRGDRCHERGAGPGSVCRG